MRLRMASTSGLLLLAVLSAGCEKAHMDGGARAATRAEQAAARAEDAARRAETSAGRVEAVARRAEAAAEHSGEPAPMHMHRKHTTKKHTDM
jgi:hypothetical protein